jgi:hypothetical protein
MKKKLITILAMLALVSTFAMAVENVFDSATAEVDSMSLETGAAPTETATVVADAASIPFVFELQANDGDTSTWASAAGKEVYDASWDVRAGFTANFRILATAGSQHTATSFTIGITAEPLKHVSDTSVTAGAATISGADGTYLDGSFDSGTNKFSLTTATNHTYAGAAGDAVTFDVAYAADEDAIAGRYTSDVTVTYTVS